MLSIHNFFSPGYLAIRQKLLWKGTFAWMNGGYAYAHDIQWHPMLVILLNQWITSGYVAEGVSLPNVQYESHGPRLRQLPPCVAMSNVCHGSNWVSVRPGMMVAGTLQHTSTVWEFTKMDGIYIYYNVITFYFPGLNMKESFPNTVKWWRNFKPVP